ncbi:tripartite tricarboxylate transporter permease [Candidatus Pacearchaeota archaeon]|nr:tripartite tricarboxylate transporter permease [Candidatus Pacearchaeota archaeon]
MLLQLIFSLLLGIFAGTITGLIPGLHINLIGSILVSLSAGILIKIDPIILTIFVVSMAIAHTFIDFIPSIFIGAPDDDTVLSILPGHEMLKEGKGYQAIVLTAYGSLAAIFVLIIITYPSVILITYISPIIQNIIPYLLIFSSLFLISTEKRKPQAILIFLLTGFLGICVFLLSDTSLLSEPLLPLLSGLFGASSIITSINSKPEITPQEITKPHAKLTKPLIASTISSPLCSFLPGLGSGQAAIIGSSIISLKKNISSKEDFLILLGATNTLVMGFSFISLYAISKTRTGASLAIKEILPSLTPQILILIIFTIFISGIISYNITLLLAKFFSQKIQKINYAKVSYSVLIFLTILVFLISGTLGLIIFTISTATGIFCINLGTRRTNMMGCLLLPTIIFYLTI